MKTAHIYLLAIGLLMYVSYSAKKDNYQEQQQKAEVHRQFCSSNVSHPNCKWSTKFNFMSVAKSSSKKFMPILLKMQRKLRKRGIQLQK